MNGYTIISNILKEAQFMNLSGVVNSEGELDEREVARAIRLAICAEHEAIGLYELIADKTINGTIKRVLQDIADEEKVHVGELEKVLSIVDPDDISKRKEGREEVIGEGDE